MKENQLRIYRNRVKQTEKTKHMILTIAYVTNRKDPKAQWFADSLALQLQKMKTRILPSWDNGKKYLYDTFFVEVLFVSYHSDAIPMSAVDTLSKTELCRVNVTQPFPSYCQGPHRLTKQDYFSATISRNTAFAEAGRMYQEYHIPLDHHYITFVDDLSVLQPEWLYYAMEAASHGYVVQGTYQKHRNMIVENGKVVSSVPFPEGKDSRIDFFAGKGGAPHVSYGNLCYGCSLGMPLKLAFQVNGYDEICSILGYEDTAFGMRLEKAKAQFRFEPRMITIESEEDHFTEGNYFLRVDPETDKENYMRVISKYDCPETWHDENTTQRWDASHALLDIVRQNGILAHGNGYVINDLREKIKEDHSITVKDMAFPETFWFTGEKLSDM